MTTKTANGKKRHSGLPFRMTDAKRERNFYNIQKREREIIRERMSEMPANLPAIMTAAQVCKYLGVGKSTLHSWHDRGVLVGIVNKSNGYKKYLFSHVWVFKILWMEDNDY